MCATMTSMTSVIRRRPESRRIPGIQVVNAIVNGNLHLECTSRHNAYNLWYTRYIVRTIFDVQKVKCTCVYYISMRHVCDRTQLESSHLCQADIHIETLETNRAEFVSRHQHGQWPSVIDWFEFCPNTLVRFPIQCWTLSGRCHQYQADLNWYWFLDKWYINIYQYINTYQIYQYINAMYLGVCGYLFLFHVVDMKSIWMSSLLNETSWIIIIIIRRISIAYST